MGGTIFASTILPQSFRGKTSIAQGSANHEQRDGFLYFPYRLLLSIIEVLKDIFHLWFNVSNMFAWTKKSKL
jgi:hypothetical protein